MLISCALHIDLDMTIVKPKIITTKLKTVKMRFSKDNLYD